MPREAGTKLITENRRARHEYHLLDRVEAGLQLTGTEVKSLRQGHAVLQRAYGDIRGTEAWLVGVHIPEYVEGNTANHDPDRDRKLLLHRREIEKLAAQVGEKGLALVPTRLYFKDGRVKVELAVARGKELRDKRRTRPTATRSARSSARSRTAAGTTEPHDPGASRRSRAERGPSGRTSRCCRRRRSLGRRACRCVRRRSPSAPRAGGRSSPPRPGSQAISPARSPSPVPSSGSLLVTETSVNPSGPEVASATPTDAVTALSE